MEYSAAQSMPAMWICDYDLSDRKFTGKERDAEAGLDFFEARYMSSSQGRFTSPDPILIMDQRLLDPQQWNAYGYARNNPLRFFDPTGKYVLSCADDVKDCNAASVAFEKARQKDLQSKNEAVQNAAAQYGKYGDDNGVTIRLVTDVGMKQELDGNSADAATGPVPGANGGRDQVEMLFQSSLIGKDLQRAIAHEGVHLGDDLKFMNSFDPSTGKYAAQLNFTSGETETRAYLTAAAVKRYNYPTYSCGTGPCEFGPKDAVKVHQFVQQAYPNFVTPVFGPITSKTWPQQ